MKKNKKQPKNKAKRNSLNAISQIVPQSASQLKADVALWKSARAMAGNVDNQRLYALQNLYKEIGLDALLSSQIQIRRAKATAGTFSIKDTAGKVLEDLTAEMQKSSFIADIITRVWERQTHGHTVLEFSCEDEKYTANLIPRQNVVPSKGIILKDYNDDKGINYREAKEYGSWIVELGEHYEPGLLNKAVPHVIFKRFAQTCWSELCEIYGIPPRVMKTNTTDTAALLRAENMMRDMGAAAWFIIDDTEEIEWATGVNTKGEVYKNLMDFCDNQITLLISGAVVGQDTKNGSNAKEQTSVKVMDYVVQGDRQNIESAMCDVIMPALYLIGYLPAEGLRFEWEKAENLSELWTRTKEVLPYKKVNDQWIKSKFGIEVEGDRIETGGGQPGANSLKLSDFFV